MERSLHRDVTADLLAGSWSLVGERPFPGWESIRCQRFLWSTPGGLEIPFLVPLEAGPRRFFAEPWLEAWHRRRAADDFVDTVCEKGLVVLAETNRLEKEHTQELAGPRFDLDGLRFFLEVFKMRRTGRESVNRRLYKRDLFSFDHGQQTCLVPGISGDVLKAGTTFDLVGSIVDACSEKHHVSEPGFARDAPFESLLGYAGQLFVDGGDERSGCASKYKNTWNAIANLSICGLDLCEDQKTVLAEQKELRNFTERLYRGWLEKEAGDFSRWIRSERQRKWHRLLGDYRSLAKRSRSRVSPSVGLREVLKEKGTRYFRVLLWLSYVQMGLSFGAVLTSAWITFCSCDLVSPTIDERRIFRVLNHPQFSLAGLPLSFISPAALSWIMPLLVADLNGNDRFASDHYQTLLGLYATSVAEVRGQDRVRKATRTTSSRAVTSE